MPSHATACPAVVELQPFARGARSDHDIDALVPHLRACARCVVVLSRLVLGHPPEDPGRRPLPSPTPRQFDCLVRSLRRSAIAAPRAPDTMVRTFPFLAPPREPGELGWLDEFRVLEPIGRGGMAIVFRAEDPEGQQVALKVLCPSQPSDPFARERFLREARHTVTLRHPNIATVYQVGEDRGVIFLVAELLQGGTLEEWLTRGRRPSIRQSVHIGQGIADGLAVAHACGLIHRDVKPANIWLDSSRHGMARLLDFGLARSDEDIRLTTEGGVVGTPLYMSPEQARGDSVDHTTDLFSLGCVLYRLLTNRFPFSGATSLAVMMALGNDHPRPPHEMNRKVPEGLSWLIMRMLAKKPADRPVSARLVAEELRAIDQAFEEPEAAPVVVEEFASVPGRRPHMSRRQVLGAVAVGALTAAAAVGLSVVFRPRRKP